MNRSTKAIVLFIAPPVGIVVTLVLYALTNASVANAGEAAVNAARVARLVLGLLGVASVLGFFIGWPMAIYLLVTKGKKS